MTAPFYVSPEQIMRDKSDYARKGIARGRSVLVMTYADGILFCGENPSKALHKISEIYDRIAFAAVGKYNEFENLRQAGVRYADLRGYQYDRSDVTSRGLANAYAQTLGTIFTESGKPYEIEITVAEVGEGPGDDQLYRLTYDGSVAEEHAFIVMGGNAEPIAAVLRDGHDGSADLDTALRLAVKALGATAEGTESRVISADGLEAAVLDRTRPRRAFKRLTVARLDTVIDSTPPTTDEESTP
ncbi:MAG TPA: proteasome subunit alpha [Mycobacteriales bacterium]|nr:proteasome subunit alpha [Mycobacteriales bacterium]